MGYPRNRVNSNHAIEIRKVLYQPKRVHHVNLRKLRTAREEVALIHRAPYSQNAEVLTSCSTTDLCVIKTGHLVAEGFCYID
jgi:hypothetical protein